MMDVEEIKVMAIMDGTIGRDNSDKGGLSQRRNAITIGVRYCNTDRTGNEQCCMPTSTFQSSPTHRGLPKVRYLLDQLAALLVVGQLQLVELFRERALLLLVLALELEQAALCLEDGGPGLWVELDGRGDGVFNDHGMGLWVDG